MPKYKNYYVVEYRLPIVVEDINSVQEATTRAKRICENKFGFNPDNWYARIFEYSIQNTGQGPIKEYFYNPNSSTYREIESNIGYHNDLVSRGEKPFEFDITKDPFDMSEIKEILEEGLEFDDDL